MALSSAEVGQDLLDSDLYLHNSIEFFIQYSEELRMIYSFVMHKKHYFEFLLKIFWYCYRS